MLEPRQTQVLRTRLPRRKCEAGKNAAPISPIALEAVSRIDAIFDIEREVNLAVKAEPRLAARGSRSVPLVAARLKSGCALNAPRSPGTMPPPRPSITCRRAARPSRGSSKTDASARKIGGTSPRGLALGRKSWLFAGSERGAERAAIMYTLIQTAKLNDIDPQAWLADTLSKIAETPQTRLGKLLPWNWMSDRRSRAAA